MAMKLDSDDAESRSLVAGLLDQIIKYCGSDNVVDALRRISDRSWITGITGGKIVSPVLLSTPDRSLGSDLAERWSGRRFTSLRVFTGSTDREGRFIRWCHETFGVEHCIVVVDPRTASFDPAALEALPVRVEIQP